MTAKPKRVTKPIRISVEKIDMLDFMAKGSNQSRQHFLEQIIEEIFVCAVCFKSFKMTFTTAILDNTVEIELHGDSVYKIGEFEIKSDKK